MFWDDLSERSDDPASRERRGARKPIIGLSPMDGVTDAAFRFMVAKYGQPDVMFSEFVSVDALHYATGDRRERLLKTFIYDEIERPIIAQVFGNKPEFFVEAAVLIEKLGFDGIDINMGCPAHKVEENGSGAGLIRTPKLAQEIILAVKSATKLPVSVKTRIGVETDVSEWWMEQLMEVRPAMISLHGRTLRQLYQGSADWEAIGRAAKVVHKYGGHILGNGDIESVESGKSKVVKYGVDGVLIGRAAEGNPAIFNSPITNSLPAVSTTQSLQAGQILQLEPSKEQRLAWMVEHAKKFEELFEGNAYPPSPDGLRRGTRQEQWFLPVRKHLAWYCKGFPGAVEMRAKLVQANSADEVEKIVLSYS